MAKQQKMDDEDSLKRRARRRLIGAVALTTVVVVVLPMVLEKEPKPTNQNIELRIPDKNSVGEFNPKMEPVPASAPAVTSSPTEATDKPSAEADTVAAAPKTDAAQSEAEAKPAQPKSAKPATEAAPDKSAPKVPTAANAADKPIAGDTQAVAKSGFVVQVGAYSNARAARDLQKKLSQLGIKVFIEKAGKVTRVRAGPFNTREEAIKIQSRIEAQGLKPIVTPLM